MKNLFLGILLFSACSIFGQEQLTYFESPYQFNLSRFYQLDDELMLQTSGELDLIQGDNLLSLNENSAYSVKICDVGGSPQLLWLEEDTSDFIFLQYNSGQREVFGTVPMEIDSLPDHNSKIAYYLVGTERIWYTRHLFNMYGELERTDLFQLDLVSGNISHIMEIFKDSRLYSESGFIYTESFGGAKKINPDGTVEEIDLVSPIDNLNKYENYQGRLFYAGKEAIYEVKNGEFLVQDLIDHSELKFWVNNGDYLKLIYEDGTQEFFDGQSITKVNYPNFYSLTYIGDDLWGVFTYEPSYSNVLFKAIYDASSGTFNEVAEELNDILYWQYFRYDDQVILLAKSRIDYSIKIYRANTDLTSVELLQAQFDGNPSNSGIMLLNENSSKGFYMLGNEMFISDSNFNFYKLPNFCKASNKKCAYSDNHFYYVAYDENNILQLFNIENYLSVSSKSIADFRDDPITISPNPSDEFIWLNNPEQYQGQSYQIVSADGSIFAKGILKSGKIRIEHLNAGIYFLIIQNRYSSKFSKI